MPPIGIDKEVVMTTEFGCARCYGDDPQAVFDYQRDHGFTGHRPIITKSHFIVSLIHCGLCSQPFVSIFRESIDWAYGQDPQYTDLLPVTRVEAETILAAGEDVDLRYLGQLGDDRRRLSTDWPSGVPQMVMWRIGAFDVRRDY
jgi:hypothetical protein